MEYFENILKKTGWSSLITSIIFAILARSNSKVYILYYRRNIYINRSIQNSKLYL